MADTNTIRPAGEETNNEPRNVYKDLEAGKRATQVFASATGRLNTVESAKALDGALMVNGQMDHSTQQKYSDDHKVRNVGETLEDSGEHNTEQTDNLKQQAYSQNYGIGRSL